MHTLTFMLLTLASLVVIVSIHVCLSPGLFLHFPKLVLFTFKTGIDSKESTTTNAFFITILNIYKCT